MDSVKVLNQDKGENWISYHGDCVEVLAGIPDESIGYSVFSPPFASLYVYSNSERDMGNSANYDEFFEHFGFVIDNLFRVIKPGRLVSVHCMNLPTTIQHHGEIGIQDFRGDIIAAFKKRKFVYHAEVCIWKDPVTAMQRTKALGLLHKQVVKDSCMSRMGIPDYVCTFRKPGVNPEPVAGEFERFIGDQSTFKQTGKLSIDVWQRYASPIWSDINPSRTLQYMTAREENDERHICPLQLDVVERCMEMWSNEGDTVLSPYGGIGTEGVVAVEFGRRSISIELKESYWRHNVANHKAAEKRRKEIARSLFPDCEHSMELATAAAESNSGCDEIDEI
jgi:DNA modification methylase